MNAFSARWRRVKPFLFPLILGMIIGPFFSSYMGWQVRASSANADLRAGILATQASYCAASARLENKEASKLDWTQRTDLAKKWAPLPGSDVAESDVTRACADKLASS